jgi:hypothetical protein
VLHFTVFLSLHKGDDSITINGLVLDGGEPQFMKQQIEEK